MATTAHTTNELRYSDEPFTADDWIWLAGFLDARGMITLSHDRPRLFIRHYDFDVLDKIGRMIDANVRGPFRDNFEDRKEEGSPYWVIQLSAYEKVMRIYEKIEPYLSDARIEQYQYVLDNGKLKRTGKRLDFDVENCGHFTVPIPSQSGYRKHLRNGDMPPCRVCAESSRFYDRDYRDRQ
jgi:hypothetical protein